MKRTAEDRRFSKMIRKRDGYRCQRCHGGPYLPNSKGLHSAHCFGRGKPATRLDPQNACALCYGCHSLLDSNPALKETFFRERLGDEAYEALQRKSNHRIGWVDGTATGS